MYIRLKQDTGDKCNKIINEPSLLPVTPISPDADFFTADDDSVVDDLFAIGAVDEAVEIVEAVDSVVDDLFAIGAVDETVDLFLSAEVTLSAVLALQQEVTKCKVVEKKCQNNVNYSLVNI
jgi:hypothetical protein